MNRYNLEYEANGERTELRNITQEQVREFLKKLKREEESTLKVKRVEEERER